MQRRLQLLYGRVSRVKVLKPKHAQLNWYRVERAYSRVFPSQSGFCSRIRYVDGSTWRPNLEPQIIVWRRLVDELGPKAPSDLLSGVYLVAPFWDG